MLQANFPIGSRSITVYGLTQYDYGQVLEIYGLPLPAVVECQISLQNVGGTTESLAGVMVDNVLRLNIPDTYLAQDVTIDYAIYLFVYVTTEDSGTTVYKVILPVTSRPEPEGYVPGETSPFAAVIDEITDLVEDAQEAATASESWAVGGTGTRAGENTDNASYYATQAGESAVAAASSEGNAAASESNAASSERNAAVSETNAAASERNAADYAGAASSSAYNAGLSETAAEGYANSASSSASGASTNALKAEGYAVGKQNGSDVSSGSTYYHNNAEYYADQAAAQLTLVTNAKDDALGDISTAKTNAVGDVNNAKTTAVGAVQDKGTEVLNSIPADYTTLSNDVSELKSDFNALMHGIIPLGNLTTPGYIRAETGKLVIYGATGWSATDYIDITEVNKLIITSTKASVYNAFYTENKTFINSPLRVINGTAEIAIPENAKYIRLSNTSSEMETTTIKGIIYQLENEINQINNALIGVADRVTNTENEIDDLTENTYKIGVSSYLKNYYIDKTSGVVTSLNYWSIYRITLHQGDYASIPVTGTDWCLATCADEEPTTSSVFSVVKSGSGAGNTTYNATEDVTLYISVGSNLPKIINVTNQKTENVNSLDKRITELKSIVKSPALRRVKPYNDAYTKITEFDYSGGDNPWIVIENQDNYEEYGTYIDNKITDIPNGDSFLWITDTHYPLNRKKSGRLVDYVRRRGGLSTMLHGGDVMNERPLAIDAAKDWLNFNTDYVGRSGSAFKQVCGDHDHNARFWASTDLREQYNLTDVSDTVFTCKFVQKVLTGYCEDELVFDDTYNNLVKTYNWSQDDLSEFEAFEKMYYYFDDANINTRFIVLFTGWSGGSYGFPNTKSGSEVIPVQMEFLYKALVTAPMNYNVVVCGHDTIANPLVETVDGVGYYNTNTIGWNGNGWLYVSRMLSALKNKGVAENIPFSDWSTTYQSWGAYPKKSFDFTNANDLHVLMTIGGDEHWDILGKTTKTDPSTITKLNDVDTINLETDILHVVTMTDGTDRGYRSYQTREPIEPPATAGTINEQAFDVITINNDGIFFTRIGSGDDRTITFTTT